MSDSDFVTGPKAIETVYGGYRFRSRLEARWAVFFDKFDVPYGYEREGFELPAGKYLPDFWLPFGDTWAEIKGAEFTPLEYRKCAELCLLSLSDVLLLSGLPLAAQAYPCYFRCDGQAPFYYANLAAALSRSHSPGFYARHNADSYFELYLRAVDSAKAARFEYGERG